MYFPEARQENLLGAAALAVADRLDETLTHGERGGLSGVAALVHIRLRPGQAIEFLARVLALSHSATVRLVDRLQADGLVERRSGRDGRSVALFVTPAGETTAVEALRRRNEALAEALVPLSAKERHRLAILLEKLLAGLTGDRWNARHICRLCDFPACTRPYCPVNQAAQGESIPVAPLAPTTRRL
jgi:MarR family transcriptional repressor of emrRAB